MLITPRLIEDGWRLLILVSEVNKRGLMPGTIERLFCDSFDIRPNGARELLAELCDRGHFTFEPGWVTLERKK